MISTHSVLVGKLTDATTEVFETMVFRSVEPLDIVEGDRDLPPPDATVVGVVKVVGTVGFAGTQSGLVTFHSSMEAAKEIAGAMLGMTADEVNDEVPDAIGEITNMIAGSFRTKMAENGDPWAISVPTVTVGSDFRMRPTSCKHRALLPFRMGEASVYVELILGS